MQKFDDASGTLRRRRLTAAGSVAIAIPIVFGLLGVTQSSAQSPTPQAALPAFNFEVASVTPSNPDAPDGFMTLPGLGSVSDRFTARNLTLMKLIRAAYGIPFGAEDRRISGGANWLNSEKYDVNAKIDSSMLDELKKLSPDQRTLAQQHMLQTLLADRFKLTIRRETRDIAIYTLVIAKNGPTLQEANPAEIRSTSFTGPGRVQSITGQATPIANLVRTLSVALGRPVLDKTELPGKYDFKLEWVPDDSPALSEAASNDGSIPQSDSRASSIFEAIQEQLGLKLVSGKGPVEIIMIDHVERPLAN